MKSLLTILLALLPICVLAKGEGVGLWMEGQVSEVRAEGSNIRLVVTGRFWFEQYRGQERSLIEVKDLRGGPAAIPAAIRQGKAFFAMVDGWGGGAIRGSGALLKIVRAAADSGKPVKFELTNARLKFGPEGQFIVEAGDVIRATDHALR